MSHAVNQALEGLPLAASAGAAGSIAQDGKLSLGFSVILGWVLFPEEIAARIEISVNGNWIGRARLGIARPDLAALARKPEASICGFEFWLEAQHIPPGVERVTVAACAMGTRGSVAWLTSEVEVELEGVERASADGVIADDELADDLAVLRDRVQTQVKAAPPAPTSPLRLLVFMHSLELGGAQLFLLEAIRLMSVRLGSKCAVVGFGDGPLREVLEGEDVPVHVVERDRSQDPIAYEGKMLELAAWAALQKCNVVLANTTDTSMGVDLAERFGIPAVWFIHESYDLATWWGLVYGEIHPYMWARMLQAMRTSALTIFEAEATRRQYLRYGNEERLVTAQYGLLLEEMDRHQAGIDRCAVRRQLGIAEDATVLLCVGTIEPRKGQTPLALAFAELADEFPDAVLVLVGEMGYEWIQAQNEGLRRFVCRARLESRLLIVPVTTDPYHWLAAADVFVMASDLESLPRVLLEAMAFELPVLATSIFGVPELIEDGRTGYLCEALDIGALREGLRRVLAADPHERAAVGRAGAEHVRRHNDARPYANWLADVLQQLVAEPHVLPDLSPLAS